ncbi:MAG: hypothetical protein M3203_15435 [Actinomycetota bacterium]|nr:hypothetical protein [Actinomycetota bacterium]
MQTQLDLPTPDAHHATSATCDLIAALEADPRYRRDSFLGGMFHIGYVSYRDVSPVDSLHIVIRGDRVSAHVDDVSPLVVRADGTTRYAWGRVLAHNLAVVLTDIARRARGVQGLQRCNLRCDATPVDDA